MYNLGEVSVASFPEWYDEKTSKYIIFQNGSNVEVIVIDPDYPAHKYNFKTKQWEVVKLYEHG